MSPAGFWVRMMAHNIDFLLYLTVAFVLTFMPISILEMCFALCLLITIFETICASVSWQGTPGKKYFGLKITNQKGLSLKWHEALLRAILKWPSLLLFFAGFALINFRADSKALHDLIVGTQVMKSE